MKQTYLFMAFLLMSCADGEDGSNGESGQDGESCTVEQAEGGAVITCSDGTTAFVSNGVDGSHGENGVDGHDGADGQDGAAGEDGADGVDGTSCSVTEHVDGAMISCPDGTSAFVSNGKDAGFDYCEILSDDCLSYSYELCAAFHCSYSVCQDEEYLMPACEVVFKQLEYNAAWGVTCFDMAEYAAQQPCF